MTKSPNFLPLVLCLFVVVYIFGICIGYNTRYNLDTRTQHITCFIDGNHIHCKERARNSRRQPVEVYRINRERINQ